MIKIIEAIQKEIPDDFNYQEDIMIVLNEIKSSTLYSAPELMPYRWKQVAEELQAFLGTPDTEWKKRIADIFMGKIKVE